MVINCGIPDILWIEREREDTPRAGHGGAGMDVGRGGVPRA